MTVVQSSRPSWPAIGRLMAVITVLFAATLFAAPRASAEDDAARKILRAMSDYVTNQKTISIAFDADIEVVTTDLQKIQFASSGQVLLSRPDKLRATRTGGYNDVEFVFDGKAFTAHDRANNVFAQSASAGSVDQLVQRLSDEFFVEAPGADLLLSRVYDNLIDEVVEAKHIGQGVVDGVECEHLAFRNHDTDWQLWVEVGPRPIPRKYVITSKNVTGAPQYTLRIKDWKTDAQIGADTFAFKQPANAKKVEFKALAEIDEVPSGVITGGKR